MPHKIFCTRGDRTWPTSAALLSTRSSKSKACVAAISGCDVRYLGSCPHPLLSISPLLISRFPRIWISLDQFQILPLSYRFTCRFSSFPPGTKGNSDSARLVVCISFHRQWNRKDITSRRDNHNDIILGTAENLHILRLA